MTLETSVPLCLRAAREEYLLALGASRQTDADFFERRANRILREALCEIQQHAGLHYDWTLLRASERETHDAED